MIPSKAREREEVTAGQSVDSAWGPESRAGRGRGEPSGGAASTRLFWGRGPAAPPSAEQDHAQCGQDFRPTPGRGPLRASSVRHRQRHAQGCRCPSPLRPLSPGPRCALGRLPARARARLRPPPQSGQLPSERCDPHGKHHLPPQGAQHLSTRYLLHDVVEAGGGKRQGPRGHAII